MSKARYLPVFRQIKRRIEQNEWKLNTQIPAERILAKEFHVSRTTLRKSIQLLVNRGWLQKKKGKGTFVICSRDNMN